VRCGGYCSCSMLFKYVQPPAQKRSDSDPDLRVIDDSCLQRAFCKHTKHLMKIYYPFYKRSFDRTLATPLRWTVRVTVSSSFQYRCRHFSLFHRLERWAMASSKNFLLPESLCCCAYSALLDSWMHSMPHLSIVHSLLLRHPWV
jgi:hypothetical protein